MTRSAHSLGAALLILGATWSTAGAQGSFVTPTTPPAPAPQSKPKPKPAPVAQKKAPAPVPPPAPAPAPTSKRAERPATASAANAKPPAKPKRVHNRETARGETKPPIEPGLPVQPSLPNGEVEVSQGGLGLLVGGQHVDLAGVALRPAPDLNQRLSSWLGRNGGVVRCVPQGTAYACRTPYGADLTTALVVSGFALPQPDAGDGIQSLAARLRLRASVLSNSSSPALTSLLDGTANPSCENPFTCGIVYIAVGYSRNNAAYNRQDWAGLAGNIIRSNYQNDITSLVAHLRKWALTMLR